MAIVVRCGQAQRKEPHGPHGWRSEQPGGRRHCYGYVDPFGDGDDSVVPFIVAHSDSRIISSHQEALNDTGEAYTAFHGWLLGCLWCSHKTTGKTKAEALAAMTEHYDVVAPGHGVIR